MSLKVSSVSPKRVHNNYVLRSKAVNRSEEVENVKPVPKSNNQPSYSSGNYLIASDDFYENLQKLTKEYKRFYADHRQFEKATKDLEITEALFSHIKELVDKYNEAIKSLRDFDKTFGTDHVNNIKKQLEIYSKYLENIGITVEDNVQLNLNQERLQEVLVSTENPLEIYKPMKGLIIKLYKEFKNINLPKNNSKDLYSDKYDTYIPGLILDDLT